MVEAMHTRQEGFDQCTNPAIFLLFRLWTRPPPGPGRAGPIFDCRPGAACAAEEKHASSGRTGRPSGFKPAGVRKELVKWVSDQRAQKQLFDQQGTESGMTQDRVAALDGIDFPWASQAGTGPPKKRR